MINRLLVMSNKNESLYRSNTVIYIHNRALLLEHVCLMF